MSKFIRGLEKILCTGLVASMLSVPIYAQKQQEIYPIPDPVSVITVYSEDPKNTNKEVVEEPTNLETVVNENSQQSPIEEPIEKENVYDRATRELISLYGEDYTELEAYTYITTIMDEATKNEIWDDRIAQTIENYKSIIEKNPPIVFEVTRGYDSPYFITKVTYIENLKLFTDLAKDNYLLYIEDKELLAKGIHSFLDIKLEDNGNYSLISYFIDEKIKDQDGKTIPVQFFKGEINEAAIRNYTGEPVTILDATENNHENYWENEDLTFFIDQNNSQLFSTGKTLGASFTDKNYELRDVSSIGNLSNTVTAIYDENAKTIHKSNGEKIENYTPREKYYQKLY